jgi:hypothetical protein
MNEPNDDAPIEEIRELRKRISNRFENDPVKLIHYYMKLQEQHGDRLIRSSGAKEPKEQDAA